MVEVGNNYNSNPNSFSYRKFITCLLLALSLGNKPTFSQTTHRNNNNITEQVKSIPTKQIDPDINNLNLTELPPFYQKKINEFWSNNEKIKDDENRIKKFTITFIEDEMNKEWKGINKEGFNDTIKLLILWHIIYKIATGDNLYDNSNDTNDPLNIKDWANDKLTQRMIKSLTAKYSFKMKAEQKAKSTKSANESLKEIKEIYRMYTENPDNIKTKELKEFKEKVKETIDYCIKRNIDYKEILKDKGLSDEEIDGILKLIDPNQVSEFKSIENDLNEIYNFCANNNRIITQKDYEKIKDTLDNFSTECVKLGIDSINLLKEWAKINKTDISLIIQYYENENLTPLAA